jgi:ABC-type dipeptide/oligopeptide/nickel transport system permease subunit
VVVAATALVGQIILIEATAEFFGFGVNSLIRLTLGNLIVDATASGIGSYNPWGAQIRSSCKSGHPASRPS